MTRWDGMEKWDWETALTLTSLERVHCALGLSVGEAKLIGAVLRERDYSNEV